MEGPVVVVGGGAAGLLAALRAARGGARTVVLEASREAGRKILVSGGGRCNILPAADDPARFVSSSPARLVRRFLARFPLAAQRTFFEELLGGALSEERETAKLFPPTGRARDVRDALVKAAVGAGAEIRTGARVEDVCRRAAGGLEVLLAGGERLRARAVVLATGGRSVLAAGADGAGIEIAARLGHRVLPLHPALVPLLADPSPHASLAGISLEARVTARSGEEEAVSTGGLLFTHRGWSGPSVLDVSHVVARALGAGREFRVTAALGTSRGEPVPPWDELLRGGIGTVRGFLSRRLPDRVVFALLEAASVADGPLHRLRRDERLRLVEALVRFPLPASGTDGYRSAEVTGGGVCLSEIDPGSGASRLVPGLFVAGEALDLFGPIGGFNFQWAWATGWTAGESAAGLAGSAGSAARVSPSR